MDNYKEKRRQEERDKLLKSLKSDEEFKKKIEKEEAEEKFRKRKDFVRRLHYERREAALDGVVLKAQEAATLLRNQQEEEERLGAKAELERRQEIRDEKLRQYVRENSHELKELEAQLKAAYVNKTLAAQLAEKEANRIEQQLKEQRTRELMIEACGTEEENHLKDLMEERKHKEEFRRSLQDQIIEKERQRQEEFMEHLKEKKFFDDIIKKIKEDENKALEEKKTMQKKLQEEMEQFQKAREEWKAREKILIEEENKLLSEFTTRKFVDTRKEQEKKAHEALVEKIATQISKEMLEQKRMKEEKEEMINTLIANEIEEREVLKAQKEMEEEMGRRYEARATFLKAITAQNQKKKEQKEMDAMFVQHLKVNIELEEKREKEKEIEQRKLRIHDRRYNEQVMLQAIQKKAESLKVAQLMKKVEEEEEERKAKMIEEERIRILKQHAPHLLGYIPKGCLRQSDLEVLGITSNTPLPEGFPDINLSKST